MGSGVLAVCVDVDEPWHEGASWWVTGTCGDCGWKGRVLYTELFEGAEDGEPPNEVWDRAIEMLLNDGTPDWIGLNGDEFVRAEDVVGLLSRKPDDYDSSCPLCLQALRWLSEWCHSWMYGRYLDDICDHWEEDEINRTYTMARLYLACKNRWWINGRRISQEKAAALVSASLAELRAAVPA